MNKIIKNTVENTIRFTYIGDKYVYSYYADRANGVQSISKGNELIYSSHDNKSCTPLGIQLEQMLRQQGLLSSIEEHKLEYFYWYGPFSIPPKEIFKEQTLKK